jgi:hypothetical protein
LVIQRLSVDPVRLRQYSLSTPDRQVNARSPGAGSASPLWGFKPETCGFRAFRANPEARIDAFLAHVRRVAKPEAGEARTPGAAKSDIFFDPLSAGYHQWTKVTDIVAATSHYPTV